MNSSFLKFRAFPNGGDIFCDFNNIETLSLPNTREVGKETGTFIYATEKPLKKIKCQYCFIISYKSDTKIKNI